MMLLRVLPFASEQMATTLNRRTELSEDGRTKASQKRKNRLSL